MSDGWCPVWVVWVAGWAAALKEGADDAPRIAAAAAAAAPAPKPKPIPKPPPIPIPIPVPIPIPAPAPAAEPGEPGEPVACEDSDGGGPDDKAPSTGTDGMFRATPPIPIPG